MEAKIKIWIRLPQGQERKVLEALQSKLLQLTKDQHVIDTECEVVTRPHEFHKRSEVLTGSPKGNPSGGHRASGGGNARTPKLSTRGKAK